MPANVEHKHVLKNAKAKEFIPAVSFQATGGFKTELLFEMRQLLEISVDRSLGIYTTVVALIIFSIKCT